MLRRFFCQIVGHRVNRHRVWHDRINFRTGCERCGTPLLRDDHRGWREFDGARDANGLREAHPHSMEPVGE